MTPSSVRQVLYEGRYVNLVTRDGWEYVERNRSSGVVLIVAVTEDRKLILTEQHRKPVGKAVLELPAGLVGDIPGEENESLETAAERELFEETGYRARHWTRLIEGPVSAGLSSEVITFLGARGLQKLGPGGGDANEDITVHEVLVDDVPSWLESRQSRQLMVDPKIMVGLFFVQNDPLER